MPTVDRNLLLSLLDHAFNKASWHGANLTGSIRGVDARLAAKKHKNRKSIWQHVLHAAYWKQRVINKLVGTQKFGRKGSNWPLLPAKVSKETWAADVAFLHAIHRKLRDVVSNLADDRFDDKTVRMIHGVAFHDIYHAGQIKLLRRLLERGGRG